MYICINIYIYIYLYIYIYISLCIYKHAHNHAHTRALSHTSCKHANTVHTSTHTRTHTHTHTHKRALALSHTHVRICMHACRCTGFTAKLRAHGQVAAEHQSLHYNRSRPLARVPPFPSGRGGIFPGEWESGIGAMSRQLEATHIYLICMYIYIYSFR